MVNSTWNASEDINTQSRMILAEIPVQYQGKIGKLLTISTPLLRI